MPDDDRGLAHCVALAYTAAMDLAPCGEPTWGLWLWACLCCGAGRLRGACAAHNPRTGGACCRNCLQQRGHQVAMAARLVVSYS